MPKPVQKITPEQYQQAKEYAATIYRVTEPRAHRDEARDIPEWWAFEIVDLIENMADPPLHKYIAKIVMTEHDDIPQQAKGILRKYFDIW